MTVECIPGRSSDAGPLEGSPLTWRDLLDDTSDEIDMAARTYRDDVQVQRKLRLEHIDKAMDSLKQARELVDNGGKR